VTTGRVQHLLVRVPPYLLIVVGIAQMSQATFGHLSPWVGGGFGMFGTLNSSTRIVVAEEWGSEETVHLRLPEPTNSGTWLTPRTWTQVTAAPSPRRLSALAGQLLGQSWTLDEADDGTRLLVASEEGRSGGRRLRGVRLRVYGVLFEREAGVLMRAPLLEWARIRGDGTIR
jgi:hypothetical protein